MDPFLQQALETYAQTGRFRRALWATALAKASKQPDYVDEHAAELVHVVFATAPIYVDARSQRLVKAFLQEAIANSDSFLRAFAAALIKIDPAKRSKQECYVLLGWNSLLLQQLRLPAAAKAAARLVGSQAGLLDSLSDSGPPWSRVAAAPAAVLKAKPALLSDYTALVTSSGSRGAVRLLLWYLQRQDDPQQLVELQGPLLAAFVEHVVNAKTRPPEGAVAAYARLLARVSHEDFSATLLPALQRMVKRSPDVTLPTLAAVCRHVSLDLSQYSGALMELVSSSCRSLKEPVRATAVEVAAAASSKMSDAAAVGTATGTLLDLVEGKAGGKLKVVAERTGTLAVVGGLAAASGGGGGFALAEEAERVVQRLCSFYATESSEEVKVAAVAAIGAWLPTAKQLPAPVLKHFETGLKDREALKRANLRCLAKALQVSPTLAESTAPLAKPLGQLVTDGVAKVAVRSDGVVALYALAVLAAHSPAAAAQCKQDKVWKGALAASSPLLTSVAVARLADPEAALLGPLAETLLLQHAQQLDAQATAAVCQVLVLAGLHPSPPARRAAIDASRRLVAQSGQLAGLLVNAARHWLRQPFSGPTYIAATDEGGVSRVEAGQRFAAVLLAATPRSSDGLDGKYVAQLAMAACHPVVTTARRARPVWADVSHRLSSIPAIIAGGPDEVVAALLAADGLSSPAADERVAALAAVRALMAAAPEALHAPLTTVLASELDTTAHDQVSATDIAKWRAPEGVLAAELAVQNGFQAQEVEAKNVRKARGRLKMDYYSDSDDDAPPKPVSNGTAPRASHTKPVGKPAGKAGKKDPAAERRERLLAEEAQVRSEVAAIKAQLDQGLALLAAAAAGNPPWTAQHLEALGPLAARLLSSELVGEGAAWDATAAMARCLPGALQSAAPAVASALRLVALQDATGYPTQKEYAAHPAVQYLFAMLSAATAGGQPLPGPAWAFVFPIVQALLGGAGHTKLHDEALAVVALHVTPGAPLPRAATLRLLYHLLGVVPAYRERIQPLLVDLCAGCSGEDLPAALSGLLAAGAHVRAAALAALPSVPVLASGLCPDDPAVSTVLWMTKFDASPANGEEAENVWEESGAQLSPNFAPVLMPYLGHQHQDVRAAAADALAAAVEEHPDSTASALAAVTSSYDGGGLRARSGSAQALRAVAPLLQEAQVSPALDFLLSAGLADPDGDIREAMVSAGVTLVDSHGAAHSESMMALFERYLDGSGAVNRDEANFDHVREGVVVLLGTLARHMTAWDDKVRSIVETLLEVLTTPSQAVQRAVSGCLPPLMTGLSSDAEYVAGLVSRLLAMVQSPSYGDRRGGAYGIAGVVKGLGITALRGHGIMDALKADLENKSSPAAREGGLFAFEALVDKLGRLFEPYVIHILPMLLACFGDGDPGVREATDAASRAIMSHLSGQGVKLVLPALLTGVEDRLWRTKQGSIQMLGAMAYCAPKQLSTALPTIVPRLSTVLSDPHPKVQASARTALQEVGSVIRNPEVSVLVPTLLSAIADPAKHTRPTLEVLLDTVFINTVDAASLALIVPVVARGLRDRSGDAKRKAARIVGNMCALINEPKDMAPYVGLLMPELQAAVVDPLPEVRATAARALGSLLRGMGAQHFTELVPWLLATLRSEGSGVERSGAAQGLAEVLAVLGPDHLAALLPDILQSCRAARHFEREGALTLFKFLPLAVPDEVQVHLENILPAVLGGLADEAEGVRSAALAAGRTLVDLYSLSALELLLPAILQGTAHRNWRIRQSSIELLGALLFKVAGTTGNVRLDGDDDEEGASTEEQGAAILAAFGYARRNEVLARIFMARSDVGYSVRTAAVHVWKTVVSNTPRTTTEILPVLMSQLIEGLSCADEERQQMSAGCLGELVRKMGERVLQKIIPILQDGMNSGDAGTRQGVCAGIQEVLENVTRQQLGDMLPTMLPTIQTALCDDNDAVRTAAGGAFGILFRGGAGGAVDSVIPSLLAGLAGPEPGQALAGLRVILGVRPGALGSMLPRLLKPPLTRSDITALGSLSEVAGASVHGHLSNLMPPLLELASSSPQAGDERAEAAREAITRIVATVTEEGAYLLVAEVVKALEEPSRRRGAADAIVLFCTAPKYDIQEHLTPILTALLPLFIETDEEVVQAVWAAAGAATAAVPKELGPAFVRTVKEGIATAVERQRRKRLPGPLLLPGLCLPKALAPLLPVYLQGVLQGSSAELRELAAEGLGELVTATGDAALKPFVVQITGPLIRIISDRFASGVKAAILGTLAALLAKAGPSLKPFLPQLQTTFLKCLADPSRAVRRKAGENLGQLAALSPRVDQLAGDQLASQLHSAEPALKEGFAAALRGLLATAGARLSPPVVAKLGASLATMLPNAGEDEALITELAGCLGEWAVHAAATDLAATLQQGALSRSPAASPFERQGRALTVAFTIQCGLPRVEELGVLPEVEAAVERYARDDCVPVKVAAASAAANLVTAQLAAGNGDGSASLAAVVPSLVGLLGPDQPSEVQRAGMQVLRRIAAAGAPALAPHLSDLLPLVAACAAAGAGPTRLAAERTLSASLRLPDGVDFAHEWLANGKPGATARGYLTEPTLRRLARLQLEDDDGALL